MTMAHSGLAAAALLAAVAMMTVPADAGGRGKGEEPLYRSSNLIDLHVRYPGDSSYSFGTYRHRGPEKGPYVERCAWTANDTLLGLPLGITQRCVRYTDETAN